MQFNTREIVVPMNCAEIELTLKHSGRLDSKVMGHDWVLAKSSDVSGILNAAIAAGASHGYVPAGDTRIIAATRIVGGGESAVVKFSGAALKSGESYTYFCTTPGHATLMRGKFILGAVTQVAREGK
jgi:azurin